MKARRELERRARRTPHEDASMSEWRKELTSGSMELAANCMSEWRKELTSGSRWEAWNWHQPRRKHVYLFRVRVFVKRFVTRGHLCQIDSCRSGNNLTHTNGGSRRLEPRVAVRRTHSRIPRASFPCSVSASFVCYSCQV